MAVVLLGCACYLVGREERKVRRSFRALSGWLAKSEGENPAASALRARRIGGLFADECAVLAEESSFEGVYGPDEMIEAVFRGRALFLVLRVEVHDLEVKVESKKKPKRGVASA